MFFELAIAVVAVVDVVCCEAGPSPAKEMNSCQQRSAVYIKNNYENGAISFIHLEDCAI